MPKPDPPPPRRIAHRLGPTLRAVIDATFGPGGVDQVAKASGVHRSVIFYCLAGKRDPTLETLERICAACGLSVADLYDPRWDAVGETGKGRGDKPAP